MPYTVKQLAELSGVSPRTLRFYDEINLLNPAYYAENGYRYYGKKEMLRLQQILLFRTMGFKLDKIQEIISANDFDQLDALKSHRFYLEGNLSELKSLIAMVDETISHLEGKIDMNDEELLLAFKHPKQLEMIKYTEEQLGETGKKIIEECKSQIKNFSNDDLQQLKAENQWFLQQYKQLIENKFKFDSKETQQLTQEYYEKQIKPAFNASCEELIKFVEVSLAHPDCIKKFNQTHPQLCDYFLQAMTVFAKGNLS